jgi:hypothetical protein
MSNTSLFDHAYLKKCRPVRYPITTTIAFGLLLDRLDAVTWVWVGFIIWFAAIWLFAFLFKLHQKGFDPFDPDDMERGRMFRDGELSHPHKKKSRFQEKVEQMQREENQQ